MLREANWGLKEMAGVPAAADGSDGSARDDVMAQRVARLTPGQLDCLRLVDQLLSSKEIALALHISSHTVDQRVRQALATLGVERRAQAARIVAQYAGPYEGPYQRLIHQSPYIEPVPGIDQSKAAVGEEIRHADRAGGARNRDWSSEQRPSFFWPSLQLPFATRSNPRNEMSGGQRLFLIATIAIGAAFSAGMYLAGLESLARLLKS